MVTPGYVPSPGDLVWIDMHPQAGREQAGRRPAVVLSHQAYNRRSGLAVLCPVTSKVKGYPFEIALPDSAPVTGVVLSDQIRNLDWRVRKAAFIGQLNHETLLEIWERVRTLLSPDDE